MSGQFALNNNRKIIEMLHNSVRFGDNNKLDLSGFENSGPYYDNSDEVLEEGGTYVLGLLTPSIIMFIFFCCWCCAIPCISISKEKFKNQLCLKIFFYFCLFWSFMGWFISIKGINLFKAGLDDTVDVLDVLDFALTESVGVLNELIADRDNINQVITDISVDCGAIANDTQQDLIPEISQIDDSFEFSETFDLQTDINEATADFEQVFDVVSEEIERAFNITMTFIFIYMFIFLFVTLISFYTSYSNKTPTKKSFSKDHCFSKVNSCHKDCGCGCFMTFGCLIIFATLVVALIFGAVATAGADTCSPSPVQQVLGIVSGVESEEIDQTNIDEFCGIDNLNDADEAATYFVCHYLMCQGDNLLLKELQIDEIRQEDGTLIRLESEILDQIVDQVIELKEQLLEQADANGIAETEQCEASLDAGIEKLDDVFDTLLEVVEVFTCDSLTPIFRGVVDENSCNGVVAGLGVIYVCWLLGVISLMFALAIYPVILHNEAQNNVMEAKAVAEYVAPTKTVDVPEGVKAVDNEIK